ncbi:Hypothetical predicted protein [Pelobates cultripes]|uniref:Uncharacterized protein n=1 Tax=Pelobates cultripes TaxID=61616 RepID=A0AAD1W031_PELCU|nr:Hypothetical predicted protein [Pelobates cultripes]
MSIEHETRCKVPWAYRVGLSQQPCITSWDGDYWDTDQQAANIPWGIPEPSMGRKSQKLAPAAAASNHDIGQMLTLMPHMREPSPPRQETTTDPVVEKVPGNGAYATPETEPPVTKRDIHDLLAHFQDMFFAELNLVKAEMQAIMERLRVSEEDSADIKQNMTTQGESIKQLQTSHSQIAARMDALEDKSRQNNIKIRGVEDTVPAEEQPHLIRQRTAAILPTKHAKQFTYDGLYCITTPSQMPNTQPRDIILCCRSFADKQQLLQALRGKTPFQF